MRPKRPKLSAEEEALAARKPKLHISIIETALMRKVLGHSRVVYIELAWQCDAATGMTHGVTYDNLRSTILDDDFKPIGRVTLRRCLIELDDVGLIVFDRSTPSRRSPALGITVPHQVMAGNA